MGRIDEWCTRLAERAGPEPSDNPLAAQTGFEDGLNDDLNISAALGHLFEVIRESNRLLDQNALTAADAKALLNWWTRINSVLGFEPEAAQIPAEALALLEERKNARASKDWAGSDRIRDEIAKLGWQVKDTKEGQKLTKIAG